MSIGISAALGGELEAARAEIERLRAENEQLKKMLSECENMISDYVAGHSFTFDRSCRCVLCRIAALAAGGEK